MFVGWRPYVSPPQSLRVGCTYIQSPMSPAVVVVVVLSTLRGVVVGARTLRSEENARSQVEPGSGSGRL